MTSLEILHWDQFRCGDTPAAEKEHVRQILLGLYLPLVRIVVGRLALNFPSATVESADLIQSGVIGLMDAMDRFDPSIGVEFRTYAQARIRGSVLDELRSLDWAPRSVRDKARQMARASEILNHQLKRPPTDEEMAKALGLDLEGFHTLAGEAQVRSLRSLEALLESEGESASWPRREADQDSHAEKQELVEALLDGVSRLGERDQLLLHRYYQENKTLKEIAVELGVTESRICQIHSALVYRLRGWLQERLSEGVTKALKRPAAAPCQPDQSDLAKAV